MNETIDAVDGNDIQRVFTTRQNTGVVPDSYMTDLATGKVTKLTNNVDKTPWFHELKIERLPRHARGRVPVLGEGHDFAQDNGQAAGALLDLSA